MSLNEVQASDFGRPSSNEVTDYFRAFFEKSPYNFAILGLREQDEDVSHYLESISPKESRLRYESGKWSVREVLGHLIDVERLFLSFALRAACGDRVHHDSFDQDAVVRLAKHHDRPWDELIIEFRQVRAEGLQLFGSIPKAARGQTCQMGEVHEFSVGAIPFILQGHVLHHTQVVQTLYGLG